jgi:hypothetical protein
LGEEETEYFAVFMQGKKVGHAVHTRRVEGSQVTTSEDVSITISRVGIPVTVTMTETTVETKAGRPLSFKSVQLLGAMKMEVSGMMNDAGLIELTNSSLGAQQKSTMEWPQGAVMAEGLRLLTLKNGLKTGSEYTARIFSPGIMQAVEARVAVGEKKDVDLLGRIVKLTEVTTTLAMPSAGQITSTSYVDDDMKALKNSMAIAGMNVDMVACAKEFALGQNDVLELIGRMFVDSPVSLGDPGSASAITYWIRPNPGADFTVPTTDNQKATRLPSGVVKLVVRPVAVPAGGTLPYRGSDPAPREAIAPTRFLQSDRKEIVALARKAVGRTKSPAQAAKRIESFVADYIENKSLSVGYASAAEVAQSRQGDCSEFAVLTAAMCRAVGIPAQVVVGIAYVEDFAGHEGFGGHAWTRAYVAGKWVGLDAAFKGSGRGGHGAGHIALATGNGEPSDFFNMASALGAFKIERVQVEKRR